ncbi:MAG TPA: hypothetical protein DIC42_00275 [Holosporales bacterium]|nr:hypothetical protein [Holosporales bacterium]
MENTQLHLRENTFQGSFNFKRIVSDPELIVTGTAIFIKHDNNKVQYREEGHYTLNGTEYVCYQQQTFLLTTDTLIIQNNIGKTLHIFNVDNKNTKLQNTHICKNDHYVIDINIQSNDCFITSYSVKGPKKNYSMMTTYKRMSHNFL